MIYVYRERIRRWIGPVRCAYRQGKHVLVSIGGALKALNLSQCRPAPILDQNPHHTSPPCSSNLPSPSPPTQSQSTPAQSPSGARTPCAPQQLDEANPPDPETHAETPDLTAYEPYLMESEWIWIWKTETIESGDPRARHFGPAVRKEIEDLVRRGTFRIVLEDDVEDGANVLPSKLVLAINSSATGETKYKARLLAGGHRDQDKPLLVHTANTVSHAYFRLMMALASIFRLPIASTDVAQAFLQSAMKLLRKLYLRGPTHDGIGAVLDLKQGELVQVLTPLFGLGDAGDYWGSTLNAHLTGPLNFTGMNGNFACYMRQLADRMFGLVASHVDDLPSVGTPDFQKDFYRLISQRFECKRPDTDNFVFAGMRLDATGSSYTMDLSSYIQKLQKLP
jgi:Reverse transcriptase (RNA-dependent DNA polymerase)